MTETSTREMKAAILQLVDQHPEGVTLAKVAALPGAAGDLPFGSGRLNWCFWVGMSRAATDALQALKESREIAILPTLPVVYAAEGSALNLPIVPLDDPERPLDQVHWLPVLVSKGGAHG